MVTAPVSAQTSVSQTNSASVSSASGGKSLNVPFTYNVQDGDMAVVCLSWSAAVSAVSVSDTNGNPYTLIQSATNTAETAVYMTTQPLFETGPDTVMTSWTNSVNVTVNVFEISNVRFGKDSTIGMGTGTSVSAIPQTTGDYNVAIGCIATSTPETISAGASFADVGTGPSGGAEFSTSLASSPTTFTTAFPATLSGSASWAEVGLNVFSSGGPTNNPISFVGWGGSKSGFAQTLSLVQAPTTIGNLLVVLASVGSSTATMSVAG